MSTCCSSFITSLRLNPNDGLPEPASSSSWRTGSFSPLNFIEIINRSEAGSSRKREMTTSGSCQMRRQYNFHEIKTGSQTLLHFRSRGHESRTPHRWCPSFLTSLRLKPGTTRLLDVGHPYPQTVRNRDHEMEDNFNFFEIIKCLEPYEGRRQCHAEWDTGWFGSHELYNFTEIIFQKSNANRFYIF